jgi:hypothetical protein
MLPKISHFLLCSMLCTCLTACSSSDDAPDASTKGESIHAYYSVDLAQSWYDLYDVTVTYTDVKGVQQSLTISQNYTYDEYADADCASSTFSLSVVATPKSQTPAIDDNATYSFDKNCMVKIDKINNADNTVQTLHTIGNSTTLSAPGSAIEGHTSKSHTIFFTSYSRTE